MVSQRQRGEARTTIGTVEEVLVRGSKGDIRVLAKVDTGAARTTLDTDLAARAGLGPPFDRIRVRASAADEPEERDVVDARIVIAGKEFEVAVAITDRQDMRYHMIIGMDILGNSNFLVDPLKEEARDRQARKVRRRP
ncbi:MAG: RimK/LysX family protein [Thermoplasmata archaeon]|nr:RimK/LysX family protein [Thermoplasmata archaeon]